MRQLQAGEPDGLPGRHRQRLGLGLSVTELAVHLAPELRLSNREDLGCTHAAFQPKKHVLKSESTVLRVVAELIIQTSICLQPLRESAIQ